MVLIRRWLTKILIPVPVSNVLASVLQGKPSNFETDLIFPIIEYASEVAAVEYGRERKTDISLKVIADHARSMTFMIADGILPSNEGRGYVLRRILRRAVRHGRLIGIDKNVFWPVLWMWLLKCTVMFIQTWSKNANISKKLSKWKKQASCVLCVRAVNC